MDTIPHRQFIEIFDRMLMYVDIKGCKRREDIERRMRRCYVLMENGANRAKKKSTRIKWFGRMKLMRILMREGTKPTTLLTSERKRELGLPNRRTSIMEEIVNEAIRNPRGIVNYTLRYGHREGKKRRLEDMRRRLGVLTIHRRGIHSQKR